MYKRILQGMRLSALFITLLSAVFVLSAAFSFISVQKRTELKNAAILLKELSDTTEQSASSALWQNYQNFCIIAKDGNISLAPEGLSKKHLELIKSRIGYEGAYSAGQIELYNTALKNGNTLCTFIYKTDIIKNFMIFAIPTVMVFAMLLILAFYLSKRLAENIAKPVKDMAANEADFKNIAMYPELVPLINKIKAQDYEIKRQLIKLKTRKTRFLTVSENINEGLLLLDTDGNILSANKSAAKIFAKPEDNLLHIRFFDLTENEELISHFSSACNGSKEHINANIGQYTYNVFYSPVFENDSVQGIVMLLVDITESLQSEQLRREFTANVSHELKTPLTTILGYSQLISQGIAMPADINGFSSKIEKEASRLITLIDDIIKLSKLDEHTPVAAPQSIHMLSVARDVADSLSPKAAERDIIIDVSGNSFTVEGNIGQITELVYNLCDNAIKYNIPGGTVNITLHERTLTVSDTGIGIPPEYHDRIFERFFRVDKSRSKSVNGTGLGLSIVKHIAELYNAEVAVTSAVGKGTSISVSF